MPDPLTPPPLASRWTPPTQPRVGDIVRDGPRLYRVLTAEASSPWSWSAMLWECDADGYLVGVTRAWRMQASSSDRRPVAVVTPAEVADAASGPVCPACHGERERHDGDRWLSCADCSGRGLLIADDVGPPCRLCGGTGEAPSAHARPDIPPCPECRGTGEAP